MFLEIPLSTVTPLNSTAYFVCQATKVDSLDWYVDDRAASSVEIINRGITYVTTWQYSSPRSVLSGVSSMSNNGTEIKCEVFRYGHGTYVTPTATLTIGGNN